MSDDRRPAWLVTKKDLDSPDASDASLRRDPHRRLRTDRPTATEPPSHEPQLDPAPAIGPDRPRVRRRRSRWPDEPLEPVTTDPEGHRTHAAGGEMAAIGHHIDGLRPRTTDRGDPPPG